MMGVYNLQYIYIYMGGSINGDTQKLMVYKGKSQSIMDDDWGYPHLWKAPYDCICIFPKDSHHVPIIFRSYSQNIPELSSWGAPLLFHQAVSRLLAHGLGLFPLLGILRLAIGSEQGSYSGRFFVISIWLVALTILNNMKVNGWWIIPYIMENKKWNHQPVCLLLYYV